MRNLCFSLAVLLLFGLTINGQDSTPGECPKLEVIGPSGVIIPGEAATFVLRSDRDFPEAYKYEWSIDSGTLTSGQGTRVVEVTSMMYGSKVTATVTVTGLPADCPNSASEFAGVMQHLPLEMSDEWGEMPNDDQRGRLDLFFAELSNNPLHKGFIFLYTKNKATERRRLKLVLDHARFRKFDKSFLMFCLMKSEQNSSKLYRIPPQRISEILGWGCKPIPGALLK